MANWNFDNEGFMNLIKLLLGMLIIKIKVCTKCCTVHTLLNEKLETFLTFLSFLQLSLTWLKSMRVNTVTIDPNNMHIK